MRWAGCQSDRSKDNEEHQTCQVVTLGCGIIHHRVWGYRRDRSTEYARGATDGAPEARQIADRFHILRICVKPSNVLLWLLRTSVRKSGMWKA